MVRKKKIPLKIYDTHITVVQTSDIRSFYNSIQRKNPNLGDPMPESEKVLALAVWDEKDGGDYYLIFDEHVDIGIIAHECFHMTLALAEFYQMPLKSDSEPPAYLMEYLVKNVARYLIDE